MLAIMDSLSLGNIYESGKAKAILDGVADKMGEINQSTLMSMRMTNPTTATGSFLDLVANSYRVTRILSESDDSVRQRVTQQVAAQRMCNEQAIDTRLRAHPRVRDVRYVDYVYGSGSFAIFPSALSGTIVDSSLTNELQYISENVAAKGVKAVVMVPRYRNVRMVLLVTGDVATGINMGDQIAGYINDLNEGETLLLDEIRVIANQLGATSVTFKEIYLDGQRVLPRDIKPAWNEKLQVDSSFQDAITIIS